MIRLISKPSLASSFPVASDERVGVAHLAFSLQTGGMERLLVEFARRADRGWFRLNFFSLTGRSTPADDIEACGLPVYCLGKRSGFRWTTVWQLAAAFRYHKIQIVHKHNSGAMIYGALAAGLAGTAAVIHTRHGQRFGASKRQNWTFAGISRLIDRMGRPSSIALERVRSRWRRRRRVGSCESPIRRTRTGVSSRRRHDTTSAARNACSTISGRR